MSFIGNLMTASIDMSINDMFAMTAISAGSMFANGRMTKNNITLRTIPAISAHSPANAATILFMSCVTCPGRLGWRQVVLLWLRLYIFFVLLVVVLILAWLVF